MTLGKYRGAGMFLYTRSGEDILILLERRSDDRSWAIQGGGCPPLDSDLAETAVRETLEETGIAVAADCIERVRKYELPFYS